MRLARCVVALTVLLAAGSLSLAAGSRAIGSAAPAQVGESAAPVVQVTSRDGVFVIDATLIAPVPLSVAWDVLTDFGAMSQYVADLESSRVVNRTGNRVQVEQRGVMRWGLLSQPFHTVREVELVEPHQVSSRVLSGTIPRATTLTRLAPVKGGTEIRHHIELALESWLPDLALVALLRSETRQQFAALVTEMQRRQDAAAQLQPIPGAGIPGALTPGAVK